MTRLPDVKGREQTGETGRGRYRTKPIGLSTGQIVEREGMPDMTFP